MPEVMNIDRDSSSYDRQFFETGVLYINSIDLEAVGDALRKTLHFDKIIIQKDFKSV